MSLLKKAIAECFGTCVLTLVACGVAALSHDYLATALSFGLVIIALAYSIGNISGCHINPAVSLAMAIRKEITWKEFGVYTLSQVVGAFIGSMLLAAFARSWNSLGGNQIQYFLLKNHVELDAWSYIGAFLVEIILTFIFVFAIIGVTDKKFGNGKLGGIVIGLTLVVVHLIGLAFTGTSVNPARGLSASICQLFGDNKTSAEQCWIWVLAPFAGGALAAIAYNLFFGKKDNGADQSSNLEKQEEAE